MLSWWTNISSLPHSDRTKRRPPPATLPGTKKRHSLEIKQLCCFCCNAAWKYYLGPEAVQNHMSRAHDNDRTRLLCATLCFIRHIWRFSKASLMCVGVSKVHNSAMEGGREWDTTTFVLRPELVWCGVQEGRFE